MLLSCLSSDEGISHMTCSDPQVAGKCAYSVGSCFPRRVGKKLTHYDIIYDLNLHTRAISTVCGLCGLMAAQCMESTVIIRGSGLDMKQNRSALAVGICLQMHIHQNMNGFPHGYIKTNI